MHEAVRMILAAQRALGLDDSAGESLVRRYILPQVERKFSKAGEI